MLYLLLLPLALPSLNNGQVNPLLVGLMLAAVAACQEQRWSLAAVLLAAVVWLKLYPIALALLLVLLQPRALSWRLGLALVTGLGLPFVLQEPSYVWSQYSQWLEYLTHDDRAVLPLRFWLRDIRLLFRVWLVPLSPPMFVALQLSTAAGSAVLCWLAARRGWSWAEQLLLAMQLACGWMTLFGPSTESATWIVLAPPLLLSLLLAQRASPSFWLRVPLLASYSLLASTHLAKWFPWGTEYGNLAPQALGGAIFFATLVSRTGLRLRSPVAENPQEPPLPVRAVA
jgi:hypothetical protein